MQNFVKKFFNLFLSLLMTLTVVGANPLPVSAESGASLTGVYSFARYFTMESLNPFTNGGYSSAAVLKDSSGRVIGDLFCIEPGTHTGIGANYVNTYAETDPGVAGVIYAFHMSMLEDASNARAKYLGAQIAVWAKIRGIRDAISGLVPTAEYAADAEAAKSWALTYFDEAESAVAAVETAWNDPYHLSTGDLAFTASTEAVRFTASGDNTVYFRSDPIHLDINGDAGKVAKVLSSVTYTVSLENAPAGSKITDITGNERNTFVPAQSFRIYVPVKASVNHSDMKVNVKINSGYTAWKTEKWHSDTNQDFAAQAALPAPEKNLAFKVSFPTAEPEVKQVYTNALFLTKVAPQITGTRSEADGSTSLVWEEKEKELAKFKVTNVEAFTDTTGKSYEAGGYIQYVYSDWHKAEDGNIRFYDLPADINAKPVKWRVTEEAAPYGYSSTPTMSGRPTNGITITVRSTKCSAQMVESETAYPECESTDSFVNSVAQAVTGEAYRFVNAPEYAEFEFAKVDEFDAPISDVKFNLYNNEDIEMYDGDIIPAGTLLGILTSDENGAVKSSQLGFGLPSTVNYYVQEAETPAGFVENPATYAIKRGSSGYKMYDADGAEISKVVNKKEPKYSIESTAATVDGEKEVVSGDTVTVIDKVVIKVENVKAIDAGTTLTLIAGFVDEAEQSYGQKEFSFDPASYPLNDGKIEVEVPIEVDTKDLEGRYVVYEVLAKDDEQLSVHADFSDDSQAIEIIKETPLPVTIATSAGFGFSKRKEVEAYGEETLYDTVEYSGLKPGEKYVLKASYYDAETKELIPSLSAEKEFVPQGNVGSEELSVSVDTLEFAGKTIVVVEELFKDDKKIAEHHDLTDIKQTVKVKEKEGPVNMTSVAKFANGEKEIEPNGKVKIIEEYEITGISYRLPALNIPGNEWVMTAWLVDENGEEIPEASVMTTVFYPDSSTKKDTLEFEIDSDALAGKTITVFETLKHAGELVAEHKDLTSGKQSVKVKQPAAPEISTSAEFENGAKEAAPEGMVTLIDTVSYKGLTPRGEGYKMVASYYDAETEELIKNIESYTTFVPGAAEGTVKVKVSFDAAYFAGRSIVVVEELFQNDEKIAEHRDLADEKQTVRIGKKEVNIQIATQAHFDDEMKEIDPKGFVTLYDEVEITGIPFRDDPKNYTLRGWLVDESGNKIAESLDLSANFTATTADYKATMKFSLDSDSFAGKNITVFEELLRNGEVVATHKDLTDGKQTVHINEKPAEIAISTVAMFEEGAKEVEADGTHTLTDTISYTGLTPGEDYYFITDYYDVLTGKQINESFKSVKQFKPDAAEGTVDVRMSFDVSDYAGKSIVVIEELYKGYSDNGVKIAEHKDLTDKNQTVTIKEKPAEPKISTVAEFDGGLKEVEPEGMVKLIDTVSYEGLIPMAEGYKMVASYYDADTKELIKNIESYTTFTPAATEGSVKVSVTFDASYFEGRRIVVVEELFKDEEKIAEHHELTDENQTVSIKKKPAEPSISTFAAFEDGKKEIIAEGTAKLVDTVTYENLTVGEEYILKASYFDAESKEQIDDTLAAAKFVADTASGTIDVPVNFDLEKHIGKIVVVEELYKGEEKIAEHRDLTDENQTVTIKKKPTSPEISTVATFENGEKTMYVAGEAFIVDRVYYSGLQLMTKYHLETTLMDPETKTSYPYAGEQVFFAGEESGYIDIKIPVNTEELVGKKVVVFEKLLSDDKVIAVHEDINDEKQTVEILENPIVPPAISIATLAQFENGEKEQAANGLLKVIDKVSYHGLEIGKQYTLKAQLVEKETGDLVSVAEQQFTASAVSGTEAVRIYVESDKYIGKSLVVYESLFENEEKIAEHIDINDENQTIKITEQPVDEYTLKIQKVLRGAFDGEPAKLGIDLAESPLAFKLINKATNDSYIINKRNFVDGYYVIEHLPAGEYTLEETAGMTEDVSIEGIVYKIYKNDKAVSVILNGNKTMTFSNEIEDVTTGSIRIKKTDEQTGAALAGVEFGLYLNGDEEPYATGKTNSGGYLSFEGLKHGQYIVKEIAAAEGYYKSNARYAIDMRDTVQNTVMELNLKNTREGAKIKLIKMDSSVKDTPVEGAKYGVFKEGDDKPIETGVTDKEGTILFETRFPDGDGLYIKEIEAAPGYRLDETKHPVGIDGKKQDLYTVTVYDAPYRVSVHLTKVDSADANVKLQGAVYALYYASDVARANPIATLQTNSDGMIKVNGLKRNKYVLVETKAPDGYALTEEFKEIAVDLSDKEDKSVVNITARNVKEAKAISIKTTATINGKKEAEWAETMTIDDKVCYKNLEVGTTYVMNASLHRTNGSTFENLLSSGSAEFKPTSADGCVDVPIKLNTSVLKKTESYDIVVYESLTVKGKSTVIAKHEDKGDKDQTVKVIGKSTTPTPTPTPTPKPTEPSKAPQRDVKTGVEGHNLIVDMGVSLVGLALILFLLNKRKKD